MNNDKHFIKIGDKEIEVNDVKICLNSSESDKEYPYPTEMNFEYMLSMCLCYTKGGCPFSNLLFVNGYAILYCNLLRYQIHGFCANPAWRDFQCYRLKRKMITDGK